MELKSESGETLGFSSAFLIGLEAWANTSDIKDMIAIANRDERFFVLRDLITKAKLSRNEILLESLCASITMYITNKENPSHDVSMDIMMPLAAQLCGLGVIKIAPSN